MVQVIVPVVPTAGVVQDQPPGDDNDTNVVKPGSVSDIETVAALLGPLFVTVIVYVRSVSNKTGSVEPVFVIERSADAVRVSVSIAELLPGVGSVVVLETVAVFESEPVADALIVQVEV